MAQEDLDDMIVVKTDTPLTAAQVLDEWKQSPNDVENKAKADAAGVQHAGFIGYATALERYAARPDMEDLAHKNARNMPDRFVDQDFMRAINADELDHGAGDPRGGVGSGSAN